LSEPETAAVRLVGAEKTFENGTVAVASTSLSIAGGSFVSLVGPSGCGKSTLLRLMAGLIDPSAGHVERAGNEIGFVFQDATLMPWASVRANVILPLELKRTANAAALALGALDRVGLRGFENAYPRELSGGMRMRASIARAIVTNPQFLLMDEPFAALDEFTRFRLNDDLRALWKHNQWTVVFVTHSIREAVFLSERVVVLSPRPGKVIADITVDLPSARDARLRAGHEFADQCARISAVLNVAMGAQESAA